MCESNCSKTCINLVVTGSKNMLTVYVQLLKNLDSVFAAYCKMAKKVSVIV